MREQRQHQWKVRRSYQFPNAAKVIREDTRPTTTVGWVVNVVLNLKQAYGVVRYVVGGDRTAWLESENHFGEDIVAAEAWVRETIAQVHAEQEEEQRRKPMPQENQHTDLTDWLAAKHTLQQKLKTAGISEEAYSELSDLLNIVTGTDLEAARAAQFRDDAHDLCIQIKAASEKNIVQASAFLRLFATYIAGKLLPDLDEQQIDEEVDALHPMSREE